MELHMNTAYWSFFLVYCLFASPEMRSELFPQDDIDGLCASITSIEAAGDGKIKVSYTLRWTKKPTTWLLKRVEPVFFRVWDSDGKRIEFKDHAPIVIDRDFTLRKVASVDNVVAINMPKNAAYIAIQLGKTELVTKRICIPINPE
jgi:hypothetical protein